MRRWLAPALWAAFLLYLGSRPPDALPDTDWLFPGADKLIHAGVYGVLGFLVQWAAGLRGAGAAFAAGAVAGLAVGGVDELIQGRIGRDADVLDLAADVLGGAAGAWLAFRTISGRGRFTD